MSSGRFAKVTPVLVFACWNYALGAIFFGYDAAVFGSLQAVPAFISQFGTKNPATGKFVISAARRSYLSSLPFLGKLVGTMAVGPMNERWGRRMTMVITCLIQILGVILQLASKEWVLFTIGRVIVYVAVGFVENVVGVYLAEVVPASIRGFATGTIMLLISVGALLATGVDRAYATETNRIGWLLPTAVQLIPAVMILAGIFFTPESPRWLLSKENHDGALNALARLRSEADIKSGAVLAEINAIQDALEEHHHVKKGSWLDLFRGTNSRRTLIAVGMFVAQQLTGNVFIVIYGTTFYVQQGFGQANAFNYAIINAATGIVCTFIGMWLSDVLGRRSLFIAGTFSQLIWLVIFAAVGSGHNLSHTAKQAVVAAIMLFSCSLSMSGGPLTMTIASEVASPALREKTFSIASSANVIVSFVITFSAPYLLNAPYANLGAKLGYIFAGGSFLVLLFAIFCVPELKDRSLEEVDELFEAKLKPWHFKRYQTKGAARLVTILETEKDAQGAVDNNATARLEGKLEDEQMESPYQKA